MDSGHSGDTPRYGRRHVVLALSFLACVIAYTDRVNISVAAVAMGEHFGWTQSQKATVLSAFYVGYLLFMFLGGVLATRYGGKKVLGWSVLSWSIFTMLTPVAAMASLPLLLVARIGMGVGEAAMFPGAYEMFARWVPPSERARASAGLLSGIPIGTVIGLMGTGLLVVHYGWASSFYVFGLAGFGWVLLWWLAVHNDPAHDSRLVAPSAACLPPANLRPPPGCRSLRCWCAARSPPLSSRTWQVTGCCTCCFPGCRATSTTSSA